MEIWKDVINFEGLYQVSNLGRIKRLQRITTSNRSLKERLLNPTIVQNEYLRVSLSYGNIKKTKLIHILIAESFLDYKSNKGVIAVDHINNNKHDNNLSNLQIITTSENNRKDRKSNTGYNFIYFREKENKYVVQKFCKNKKRYLGIFKNLEDAINCLGNEN